FYGSIGNRHGGINSGEFEYTATYTAINGGMSTIPIAPHRAIKNPLSLMACGFMNFFVSC
ncbi:MAG: hypothetical protein WAV82_00840, partial [Methylobacter sp.]